MTDQPEALRLADELCAAPERSRTSFEAAAELRRLHEENARLKTVMVAAAEEIAAHWDAHCDEEGYGPANLMHRLEKGIASEYAYKAGDFARLQEANKELLEALKMAFQDRNSPGQWIDEARALIAKHGGQP